MENLSENSFPYDADLCFSGINLTGALTALAAIHSGLRVTICIEKPLDFSFQPELITAYPLKLNNYLTSVSTIRMLEKLASFYPSLIYPQRIVTLQDGGKLNARFLSLTDYLLKRDRDEASFPVRFSNFPEYKNLESHFANGAFIREFRFDRNMAIIYLLQECKKQGAIIIDNTENAHPQSTITCINNSHDNTVTLLADGYAFRNNIRIANSRFDTLFQKLEDKIVVRFQFHKPVSEAHFLQTASGYFNIIGIKQAGNDQEQLQRVLKSASQKTIISTTNSFTINDSEMHLLMQNCMRIARRLSATIGKKFSFKKWVKSFVKTDLNGEYFRHNQTVCDEKFDLAKQTGVEYNQFCYYFFRYSHSIDDLIEMAYDEMELVRNNPGRVWENVEKRFQQKIKEECSEGAVFQ